MSTVLAKRIAREHNRNVVAEIILKLGGVMVFDRDGRLLQCHASDGFAYGPDVIVYRIRNHRVTEREVQAYLDARAA